MDSTKATHTPGPWRAEWLDDNFGWITGTGAEGRMYLAEIVTSDDEGMLAPPDEQKANADLFAAAPDLLAACEELEAFLEVVKDSWTGDQCNDLGLYDLQEILAAAIAKARGEVV